MTALGFYMLPILAPFVLVPILAAVFAIVRMSPEKQNPRREARGLDRMCCDRDLLRGSHGGLLRADQPGPRKGVSGQILPNRER